MSKTIVPGEVSSKTGAKDSATPARPAAVLDAVVSRWTQAYMLDGHLKNTGLETCATHRLSAGCLNIDSAKEVEAGGAGPDRPVAFHVEQERGARFRQWLAVHQQQDGGRIFNRE